MTSTAALPDTFEQAMTAARNYRTNVQNAHLALVRQAPDEWAAVTNARKALGQWSLDGVYIAHADPADVGAALQEYLDRDEQPYAHWPPHALRRGACFEGECTRCQLEQAADEAAQS